PQQVHPRARSTTERVAVRRLSRRSGRRAKVREDGGRGQVLCELAAVAVVPGRYDAPEHRRRLLRAAPPDAEAVTVRFLCAEPRMEALDDQRVLGRIEQLLQEDGCARIGKPAAHASHCEAAWMAEHHPDRTT